MFVTYILVHKLRVTPHMKRPVLLTQACLSANATEVRAIVVLHDENSSHCVGSVELSQWTGVAAKAARCHQNRIHLSCVLAVVQQDFCLPVGIIELCWALCHVSSSACLKAHQGPIKSHSRECVVLFVPSAVCPLGCIPPPSFHFDIIHHQRVLWCKWWVFYTAN